MFVLHASNKTENLLAHLAAILEKPLSHPFIKEEFLVQSQGMERWLCQQLAQQKGVWANFDFHFPSKFFTSLVRKLTENNEVELFSQEYLVWHFDNILRDLEDKPDTTFDVLQHYMQGESEELKRYQLAEKLAYLFDQYQFMRADWLQAWQQGRLVSPQPAEKWQAQLWQQIWQNTGGDSKGNLWLSAINKLSAMQPSEVEKLLPERLFVFGINSMSPIYLSFLQSIGDYIDVHFFLLNPVKSYWADLPGKRQLAKQLATNEQQNEELFATNNPLLSALGQQGRDFQQLLLEQCDFKLEVDSFEPSNSKTLLGQLKNDILNNTLKKKTTATQKTDNSISLHACHSRMRETEVLKDQLLKALDENPQLSLRDIIVMTPDITHYAPYISAVFDDIPHAIADRSILDSNDPLSVFLRFLSLSQNRWQLESVFDVLDQEVVYKKMGLLEADLEYIRSWVGSTNIRWGESADHRSELGFPAFSENSWQAGLNRLLMGYANSDDSQFCDDVLPFAEIEGSQAQALGGLFDFFSLLSEAKKTFSKPHTLRSWIKQLTYFVDRLLVSDEDFQHAYTKLIQLITELENFQQLHQQEVSLEVILAWFTSTASQQSSAAGFLRGQLTFCSMMPMRAIPFNVIALMGMNEGEYPRQEARPAFDLMANDFRKGDRSPRVDERYQFLEVLLSAQDQLIITYLGQSKKTNSQIQPSVVVSELLEVIDTHYHLGEGNKQQHPLLTYQPLQAHSQQYFSDDLLADDLLADDSLADNTLFSYSSQQLAIANVLHNHQVEENGSFRWKVNLTNEIKNNIELHDIIAFYSNPQRYFLEQKLNIVIPRIESRADETEPFVLDGLNRFQIEQEWIERYITGNTDDDSFYQQLMAQGRWMSGVAGEISFQEHQRELKNFAIEINNNPMGEQRDDLAVDCLIGDYRMTGTLKQQYEQGALYYRYATLKGKDLLPAWINHLLMQQVRAEEDLHTWLFTKDQSWHFADLDSTSNNAEQLLIELLDYYVKAQTELSALLIEPAIVWQQQNHKSSARIPPIQSALGKYKGIFAYDSAYQLLYSDLPAEDVINHEFEQACELLTPIWLAHCPQE